MLYIKSDEKLVHEIRGFFKKDIARKEFGVPFRISDRIIATDLRPFKDDLENGDEIMQSILSRDFKPYSNTTLPDLLPMNQSSLILYFSEPIDNYLVVELTDSSIEKTEGVRFGKGFKMLFLFDERGLIKNVYSKALIYN